MKLDSVIFYGDISPNGYKISYLLINKRIEHEFVICDEFILSLKYNKRLRELFGFEKIIDYLETYQYYLDFPGI